MIFTVDFESDEALYLQLCRQVIVSIAALELKNGDSLPSVRQLAEDIGINMHTVNKAYSLLRDEGYVVIDRRHGAVISVDAERLRNARELADDLRVIVARALCRNMSREDIHAIVDEVLQEFTLLP